MNYVKHFDICGVHTRQVACIELHGKPTAATEGAVGVLGIDMDSPSRQVYKCVAVNGSVYTWELLCEGSNIMSTSVAGKAYETVGFRYTDLQKSESYTVRVGDLILDTEGYLYRVFAISSDSCTASYCGTQLVIGSDINTDELDERYVKKVTIKLNNAPFVYTNDANDETKTTHYLANSSSSYSPYNIPMLYGSAAGGSDPSNGNGGRGYLLTPMPLKDYHCANKKYVDDNFGWKLLYSYDGGVGAQFEIGGTGDSKALMFRFSAEDFDSIAVFAPRQGSKRTYSSQFLLPNGKWAYCTYMDGACEIRAVDGTELTTTDFNELDVYIL